MSKLILNPTDTEYAAREFINYFHQFKHISEYQEFVRLQRTAEKSKIALNTLFPIEDDLFSDWDMSPADMNFQVWDVGSGKTRFSTTEFNDYLDIIYSHANEKSIPGRRLNFIITETNTDKIVGLIHLASPIISIKPRHDGLGGVPEFETTNKHMIMGNIIVPAQPFGFNYLGGKLVAAVCCSHEIREKVIERYPQSDIILFETTSLYGSTKGMSMYDGMKPLLRHYGDTISEFPPNLNDKVFTNLDYWFAERNDGEQLVTHFKDRGEGKSTIATGRKFRCQVQMRTVIRNSCKANGQSTLLKEFDEAIEHGIGLTERKRYYMCNYGYSNMSDVLLKGATPAKGQNWDKHYLENIIEWWRKKAVKRYETLKSDGRLRTKLELWNVNPEEIDMIR